MKKLLIFGAGTGGAEAYKIIVEDINKTVPTFDFLGFVDTDPDLHGKTIFGYPVHVGNYPDIGREEICAAVCLMDNKIRRKVIELEIEGKGLILTDLIHPSVIRPDDFSIPSGFIAFPGVKINHSTQIGKGVIAHYNTIIGHDVEIGDYVFLGPSTTVCSLSKIGEMTTLGAAATLIPGSSVGKNVSIGAGGTVFSPVADNTSINIFQRLITSEIKQDE